MGQVRAMKIGLEARFKCKVESDWKIMEWITELAGEMLSRGRWPNNVFHRQGCPGGRRAGDGQTLEGSQIPEEVVFEGTLGVRGVGGIEARTNEHVLVIGVGRAAIRVRTVLRRLVSEKWNVDAVELLESQTLRICANLK